MAILRHPRLAAGDERIVLVHEPSHLWLGEKYGEILQRGGASHTEVPDSIEFGIASADDAWHFELLDSPGEFSELIKQYDANADKLERVEKWLLNSHVIIFCVDASNPSEVDIGALHRLTAKLRSIAEKQSHLVPPLVLVFTKLDRVVSDVMQVEIMSDLVAEEVGKRLSASMVRQMVAELGSENVQYTSAFGRELELGHSYTAEDLRPVNVLKAWATVARVSDSFHDQSLAHVRQACNTVCQFPFAKRRSLELARSLVGTAAGQWGFEDPDVKDLRAKLNHVLRRRQSIALSLISATMIAFAIVGLLFCQMKAGQLCDAVSAELLDPLNVVEPDSALADYDQAKKSIWWTFGPQRRRRRIGRSL